MIKLTSADFLPTGEIMELHELNSIECHSIDNRKWEPKGLNEEVWSHERMMRELKREDK